MEETRPRRLEAESDTGWWETLRAFAIAGLVALTVRAFVLEPFKIPSGSMIPTLLIGDYILVSKFAYGIRMPFSGEVLIPWGEPTRGDVVVFRFPDDPSTDYIKRVMGVPGDVIEVEGREVWVNGEQLDHQPEADYYVRSYTNGGETLHDRFIERNEDGDEYTVIYQRSRPFSTRQRWEVPEKSYFMMGDNRDNSKDSRRWQNTFVSEDQLKGRAFMIHWSWVIGDGSSGKNFVLDLLQTIWKLARLQVEEMRWDRIGRRIDGVADPSD